MRKIKINLLVEILLITIALMVIMLGPILCIAAWITTIK